MSNDAYCPTCGARGRDEGPVFSWLLVFVGGFVFVSFFGESMTANCAGGLCAVVLAWADDLRRARRRTTDTNTGGKAP